MIVLFEGGKARLLLTDVVRDADGSIKFADVINGGWRLEVRDGELLVKDKNYTVTRQKLPEWVEMEILSDLKGDYNFIMHWAQAQYDDLSVQDYIDEKIYCEEMLSLYEGAMTPYQSNEYSNKIEECNKIIDKLLKKEGE